jgi:hypothetical protein
MTAMSTTHRPAAAPPPEPPTPGGLPLRPLAPPCVSCGTTGGAIKPRYRRPWRAQGRCTTCYMRAYHRGELVIGGGRLYGRRFGAAHPVPPDLIVTPAMLGITRGQIQARFLTAQAQLWADEARCIVAGAVWRQAHPEQFTAAHLAHIFGDDPAPAFWHDDAARAA